MKKLIFALACFGVAGLANADCKNNLIGLGMRDVVAAELCKVELTTSTLKYGDGVTAAQTFTLSASTSDGSDDGQITIAGGGAFGTARGGSLRVRGNENSSAGAVTLSAGDTSSGTLTLGIENASASINFADTTSGTLWSITDAGVFSNNATRGGEFIFNRALTGVADQIATLAATGSTQSDAAAVASTIARVTAADATKGVKLPALSTVSAGRTLTIINSDTTNALKVYSDAAGETISGQAGTTAISLAAKLILRCTKYDSTNWYCEKSVTPY